MLKKIKNTLLGTYVINLLKGKEIVGTFNKKELQNTNQKEFRVEKVIKRKGDKLYVKWKGYDNLFNSWIDKDIELIFSRTKIFRRKTDSWIRFINSATKTALKNATGAHASKFAKKIDLANLKSNVATLDIDKLKNFPTNLSNLKIKYIN